MNKDEQVLQQMLKMGPCAHEYANAATHTAKSGAERGFYLDEDIEPVVEHLLNLLAACQLLYRQQPDLLDKANNIADLDEMIDQYGKDK